MGSDEQARLSSRDVVRLRMHALGLNQPHATAPHQVVRHHLAMQAQDWAASRWAIGSRLASNVVDADVLAAYDRGEIVRSWPMRGTVHVTCAEDLPWMLELCGQRALSGVARRWEYLGIDETLLERARTIAQQALSDGPLTRAQFTAALTDAGLDLAGQRAYHTVWYLAQTGTLVQGPTRNGEHLLVLLDQWIPKPRRLTRDEALAELVRRYLASHGPAAISDMQWWSTLPQRDLKIGIAALGEEVVTAATDGGPLLVLASTLEALDEARAVDRATHVLAAFDEHLLGYKRRDDVLDPQHAHLVDPGRNGVFRYTITRGGRVVGTWARTRRTHATRIELAPFSPLSASMLRSTEKALNRWSSFTGRAITLS